jgi:hypothetical protein
MLTRHYTARRGVGLSEIIACGDDQDRVVREALKYERHPIPVEILPGSVCPRCGWGDEEEEADFASAPERTGWAGQRRPGELTGTEGEKP